ncbi:hypothetical protein KR018_000248 [Drosophila ironensis]|nr:hypothetical protein KR018_000248 [Drosophila ironensis]
MFPNYCFTKSARQPGYDVMRRGCTAKEHPQRSGRQNPRLLTAVVGSARNRSEVRYGNLSRAPCAKPIKGRPRKLPKVSPSVVSSCPSTTRDSSSRCVGFRLPAVVCANKKESREAAGDDRSQNDKSEKSYKSDMATDPNTDLNRELQESFADFFSIIHDNVLESVQGAVERMVSKCFEESNSKIDQISKSLLQQETQLNKIYRDITSKISDQCETNLNQFKFVTQMLIDNQTVHYRALHQAKQNKQRRKEQREEEKIRKINNEKKRKEAQLERERRKRSSSTDIRLDPRRSAGAEFRECGQRAPQHLLCQQQRPVVYQMCQSCSEQEDRCRMMSQSSSRQQSVPRQLRRSASHSLPDLSSRCLSARVHPSPTRCSRTCLHQCGCRQARNPCAPAMTYPPFQQRTGSTPRRRLLPRIKSGIGRSEDKHER